MNVGHGLLNNKKSRVYDNTFRCCRKMAAKKEQSEDRLVTYMFVTLYAKTKDTRTIYESTRCPLLAYSTNSLCKIKRITNSNFI